MNAIKQILIIPAILLCLSSVNAQQSVSPRPTQKPGATNPQTATRNAAPERLLAISGRILDDAGKPVAEASVVAVRAGMFSQALNQSPNMQMSKFQRNTVTDNDGKFKLDDLAAGAYLLNAAAPGYVLANEFRMENDKPRYYRPGDNLALRMVKGSVITGTVTDQYGEPLVAMRVQAIKVRDDKNRASRGITLDENEMMREWKTDDRGIYRIYGLEPGIYVVSAGGKGFSSLFGFMDTTTSTYFPSGTRDTATPLTLQAGQEMSGIDIRCRDTKGFAISGKISKASDTSAAVDGAFISLTSAASGNLESFTIAGIFGMGRGNNEESRKFILTGVPDGDYILTAFGGEGKSASEGMLVSSPRRVTVRGGDVTGVELLLYALGSISGQFVLEKMQTTDGKPACNGTTHSIAEAVIFARAEGKAREIRDELPFNFSPMTLSFDSTPSEAGEFQLYVLDVGRYHLETSLPTEDWYIRAIQSANNNTKPAANEPASQTKGNVNQPKESPANGVNVKLGEKVEGIRIIAAEGAAGIKGRIVPVKEGDVLPASLRLFLMPAETESVNDVLRYYESELQKDGTFTLNYLAPGRYLIYLREVSEEERNETNARPLAWNAEIRSKLRKDAEAVNQTLELQPCQRLNDALLKYPQPPQAKKTEPKKSN